MKNFPLIYAPTATNGQGDNQLDKQVSNLMAEAGRRGLQVVSVHTDICGSSSIDWRGLNVLVAEATAYPGATLLVQDPTRLARDLYLQQVFMGLIAAAHMQLVYTDGSCVELDKETTAVFRNRPDVLQVFFGRSQSNAPNEHTRLERAAAGQRKFAGEE